MRVLTAFVAVGTVLSLASASSMPSIVLRMAKEGIPVRAPHVEVVQACLNSDNDGVHLFRLVKDQTYGIELTSPVFKGRLRIDDAAGTMSPVTIVAGKGTFRAPHDGSYRVAVSASGGGSGRYVLAVEAFSLGKVRPGVLIVGPGGLSVQDAINANDPPDRVRRHRCKVFEVQFQAGKTYTIDLVSQWDNYLRLEDEKQVQLAEDDDSGGFPNARIIFRAQTDGVYRVIATSFAGAIGPFNLKIHD